MKTDVSGLTTGRSIVEYTLPVNIEVVHGNHQTARDRTGDIHKFTTEAARLLDEGLRKDASAIYRGACVREADAYLDTVIRFAECAKEQLRIAYGVEP
jgi:hypothetical protein